MTSRFNRDFALVRDNGQVLAESHSADRLHAIRDELAAEGIVSSIVKSDLPRSRAAS